MTILTFSGWTQPADALHILAPDAVAVDYADAPDVETVAARLPHREAEGVIGWSLGGVIARELLARGALKANYFISLSAPYQFVRDARFEAAMPPDMFVQFYNNYRDDTARTVNRFHGLVAKGDTRQREVLQSLAHHALVHEVARWLPWMDFLETHSAADTDYSALPRTLILHGTADAIIPYAQSERLQQALPNAQHRGWEGAAHALHLHDGQRLKQEIANFVRAR